MLLYDLDPLVGVILGLRPEPKFALVPIESDLDLPTEEAREKIVRISEASAIVYYLQAVLLHVALVEVEVERALVLHLPAHVLEVLEDTVLQLDVARLPAREQRRAVLLKLPLFHRWL